MDEARGTAGVLAVGSFLPETRVTNADLEAREYRSANGGAYRLDPGEIEARTGIRERRVSQAPTSAMAVEAGKAALGAAGLSPRDIDLLLLATTTPDYLVPKTAPRVAHLLGAEGAPAYDIGRDSTGFLEALETGAMYILAGGARRVLVIGAERTAALLDPRNKATAVVFGDGAGAVVLGPVGAGRGWVGSIAGSEGALYDRLYIPAGGSARPDNADEAPPLRDRTLRMDGKAVSEYATRTFPAAINAVLAKCGAAMDDVALFVPHQANRRILEGATRSIGLAEDRVFINVEKYGNTAAASIPIALEEASRTGRMVAGDLVCLVAYGAGLSWNAALIRW